MQLQKRNLRSPSPKPQVKEDWHKKIAANRGAAWRKNMLAGRREALLNPSNIRLVRLKKDIHQAVIAKRLDMSESTFGAIERGKRLVKKDVAAEIAEILGAPLQKLFKPAQKQKYVAILVKPVI